MHFTKVFIALVAGSGFVAAVDLVEYGATFCTGSRTAVYQDWPAQACAGKDRDPAKTGRRAYQWKSGECKGCKSTDYHAMFEHNNLGVCGHGKTPYRGGSDNCITPSPVFSGRIYTGHRWYKNHKPTNGKNGRLGDEEPVCAENTNKLHSGRVVDSSSTFDDNCAPVDNGGPTLVGINGRHFRTNTTMTDVQKEIIYDLWHSEEDDVEIPAEFDEFETEYSLSS